jgi:hypothetical protein
MFTDGPVTPSRLECLIDLLREHGRREWTRVDLAGVLQPKGLPDLTPTSDQANKVVKAALELELVVEEANLIRLGQSERGRTTRDVVLDAIDNRVLASTDVEPYYAPFYSYMVSTGRRAAEKKDGGAWAIEFNQYCPQTAGDQNPFNKTKHTGLERWYAYSGHGWFDTLGVFQANPYYRVLRQLPGIFADVSRLTGDDFIGRLAECCQELDNGPIFRRTLPNYNADARVASLALSHALVDLHLDEHIRLFCAPDSRGWSIEAALPPNDGRTLRSGRIDYVEYIG